MIAHDRRPFDKWIVFLTLTFFHDWHTWEQRDLSSLDAHWLLGRLTSWVETGCAACARALVEFFVNLDVRLKLQTVFSYVEWLLYGLAFWFRSGTWSFLGTLTIRGANVQLLVAKFLFFDCRFDYGRNPCIVSFRWPGSDRGCHHCTYRLHDWESFSDFLTIAESLCAMLYPVVLLGFKQILKIGLEACPSVLVKKNQRLHCATAALASCICVQSSWAKWSS